MSYKQITRLQDEIDRGKTALISSLSGFRATPSEDKANRIEQLSRIHQTAVRFFNKIERSVGDSHLLGAHSSEVWVRGFAETCVGALESLVHFHAFLAEETRALGLDYQTYRPSSTAYAAMQRLVVEYTESSVHQQLRERFAGAGLPTYGFDNPVRRPYSGEAPARVWVPGVVFASILLCFFIASFFFAPRMSCDQKGILAFLQATFAGLSAAFFGGSALLQFDMARNRPVRFAFSATGGLAVFALLVMKPPYWHRACDDRTAAAPDRAAAIPHPSESPTSHVESTERREIAQIRDTSCGPNCRAECPKGVCVSCERSVPTDGAARISRSSEFRLTCRSMRPGAPLTAIAEGRISPSEEIRDENGKRFGWIPRIYLKAGDRESRTTAKHLSQRWEVLQPILLSTTADTEGVVSVSVRIAGVQMWKEHQNDVTLVLGSTFVLSVSED